MAAGGWKRKWVVLTKDKRIQSRIGERAALMNAGARAFILVSGSLTGPEMGKIFVKALPKMQRFVTKYPPPFIAKVFKDGSLQMWESLV
jgi:hypothetical protein